jgi:hypothetical protein
VARAVTGFQGVDGILGYVYPFLFNSGTRIYHSLPIDSVGPVDLTVG